jgi:hypothetical protein
MLGFLFFYFDLHILNGVHALINLITNSFRGRQAVGGSYADFVDEFSSPMKKSAKALRSLPSKARESSHLYCNIRIRVRGNLILADLPRSK